MKLVALAWRYLWARPLVAALNLTLLALGVAAMGFVVIVSEQVERSVQRDLAGIDLVVGARGSPLQLILAGVFHIDVPSGNIPRSAIQTLLEHPLVARVVPLSLGDSLKGFRIVGTTLQYPALYSVHLAEGAYWQVELQAVLGADVARDTCLKVGDTFVGTHGLGAIGEAHGDTPYQVTGRLARCGCVLDRLVLTDLQSVWAVHETALAVDDEDRKLLEAEREVTLLMVGYRSPLAAVSVSRWVNAQDGLQAAAPALESARLLRMVGAGTEVLRGFGIVLLIAAGASVFVGLVHAVRERESDLAMLRMLGAPSRRVALLEAFSDQTHRRLDRRRRLWCVGLSATGAADRAAHTAGCRGCGAGRGLSRSAQRGQAARRARRRGVVEAAGVGGDEDGEKPRGTGLCRPGESDE